MKITYNPRPGDSEFTTAFGLMFEAGQAVEVSDPKAIEKLRGNPSFMLPGKADPEEKDRGRTVERLEKALDGRTKEARVARTKATEAHMDAASKERAAEQVQAIADSRREAEANRT